MIFCRVGKAEDRRVYDMSNKLLANISEKKKITSVLKTQALEHHLKLNHEAR